MQMSQEKKKVFVGISGGVDSATSAAILKRDGYDVTGVFIKIWSPEWTRCSMQDDRKDAMRVCAALDIPFREIDCTEEYKKDVIDPMIESYKRGETPNPDVLCNRYVKFGAFFDYAMKEGADFVATGHYAKTEPSVPDCQLLASKDTEKDQTYFLWTLTQDELAKTLFPIGNLLKSEVRTLAKKLGVPVAEKKDSQGLCFLGDYGVDDFLSAYIKPKQGNVLNEAGEIIGTHDGVQFLTVGSRHGFTVTKQSANAKPFYIISKDIAANSITVSENRESDERNKKIMIRNVHWIQNVPNSNKLFVRTHHGGRLLPVSVCQKEKGIAEVTFKDSSPLVPIGQSLVFYKDDCCLGGGVVTVS